LEPDFQDGLLGFAKVGITANPNTVDPRLNLAEALGAPWWWASQIMERGRSLG
jgi:hypothetical protein